ncbi:MAG: pyrroline-5-carboxylate reductase [Candidatus Choladocola sp.]|nr:pyrroline-5-carboxylate reductase [Candidatus Choladocola sp.]
MKLGFIGCGNMARAILGGILKKQLISPDEIIVSALHQETLDRAAETYGIHTTLDNREAAGADILFLAVKPQFYEEVISEIRDSVSETQLIVSIAPGKSIETITGWFGKSIKLIRTMPNTPAMVGEGVTAVCPAPTVTEEELAQVITLLESCGTAEVMPERLIDAVVAVSGSSPAYVFMMIEAMADGAVRDGIPRSQAYRLAAQAVLGSAKMVLETGKHPGELKDMVCSPAGTTIEAVAALEKAGFRSAILEGMKACTDKTKGMR